MKRCLPAVLLAILAAAGSEARDFIDVEGGGMTYIMIRNGVEVVHDIWVDDFRMAAAEVTVAQWRRFTDDLGLDFCWEGHYCGDIAELSPGEDCPIQLVRIEEAAAYCNWRSLAEGLEPVYVWDGHRLMRDETAGGYRLPSTAEWDYAARGGRLSRGYAYAGSDRPEEVAWFGRPWEEGTHPVATLKPNELGLHDMSGNIREWTWPSAGIPIPTNGVEEEVIIRGGSWVSKESGIRLNFIRIVHPYTWNNIGFRLARNAE